MRAHDVAATRLVELAARVRVARDLADRRVVGARARQVQGVVAAEGVGVQVSVEISEELLRSVALAVDREVEHVVRMRAIAPVDPQARQGRRARCMTLVLDRRVVGVQPRRLHDL
jgi:hypothetical protein